MVTGYWLNALGI